MLRIQGIEFTLPIPHSGFENLLNWCFFGNRENNLAVGDEGAGDGIGN